MMNLVRKLGLPTSQLYTWAQGDGGPWPADKPVSGGVGYYWLGREKRMLKYDSDDKEFQHLNNVLQDISFPASSDSSSSAKSSTYPAFSDPIWSKKGVTVREYLEQKGVSSRMMGFADAGYANTLCASLDWLPLAQSAHISDHFDEDGHGEYRCVAGYSAFIQALRNNLLIWTNWPVKSVDWGDASGVCTLVSESGQTIKSKRVVITASVPVIRDYLEFRPALPKAKQEALQMIRTEPCVKLALRFRSQIWPADFHGVICSDSLVPEFWAHAHPQKYSLSKVGHDYVMMGFACAEYARKVSSMHRQDLIQAILQQLDEMFSTPGNAHPASSNFLDIFVQDWTNEKFVRGGYSAPSPGVTPAHRQALAAPCGNVYFAGEATHELRYMVMHSAIESGERAAREVLQKMPKKIHSKL
eukprot:TRINITY_DN13025_c0_g4_i1.p1 TRINITY_DN13025_c0_g4~~TRINITY_DN13025_c0_g4_i1.p1  ORF type:complete len:414 (+),score=49.80 TRINITY_DN13025_c0_g4_i1:85-1326(+)